MYLVRKDIGNTVYNYVHVESKNAICTDFDCVDFPDREKLIAMQKQMTRYFMTEEYIEAFVDNKKKILIKLVPEYFKRGMWEMSSEQIFVSLSDLMEYYDVYDRSVDAFFAKQFFITELEQRQLSAENSIEKAFQNLECVNEQSPCIPTQEI